MTSDRNTPSNTAMARKICLGCTTLPTAGFQSKPPNANGQIQWCSRSYVLAATQDIGVRPPFMVVLDHETVT